MKESRDYNHDLHFSTSGPASINEAVFCYPYNTSSGGVLEFLDLDCAATKHYKTIVERCSRWSPVLTRRASKDIYARPLPLWPCNIYNIECAETDKKRVVRDLICACPKNPEFTAARILCVMYSVKFVWSNFDKQTFYYFDTKRWTTISSKAYFMKEMLSGMYEFITEVCNEYMEAIEFGTRIIDFIQSSDNRKRVMYTCACVLYREDFESLLNSRRDVIGMKDSVYDFQENKPRAMEPDDYITLSSRVPFVLLEDGGADAVIDLLVKVFPNESIRTYFMRFVASCLEGRNASKIFSIWSGSGDNGKTIMVSLIEKAFGDYAVKMPTSLLMEDERNHLLQLPS